MGIKGAFYKRKVQRKIIINPKIKHEVKVLAIKFLNESFCFA